MLNCVYFNCVYFSCGNTPSSLLVMLKNANTKSKTKAKAQAAQASRSSWSAERTRAWVIEDCSLNSDHNLNMTQNKRVGIQKPTPDINDQRPVKRRGRPPKRRGRPPKALNLIDNENGKCAFITLILFLLGFTENIVL